LAAGNKKASVDPAIEDDRVLNDPQPSLALVLTSNPAGQVANPTTAFQEEQKAIKKGLGEWADTGPRSRLLAMCWALQPQLGLMVRMFDEGSDHWDEVSGQIGDADLCCELLSYVG
jgi:hypothetical protein